MAKATDQEATQGRLNEIIRALADNTVQAGDGHVVARAAEAFVPPKPPLQMAALPDTRGAVIAKSYLPQTQQPTEAKPEAPPASPASGDVAA